MEKEEFEDQRALAIANDRLELAQAFADVFRGPPGQKVLHFLLDEYHMKRSCFDRDALEMARMEGERNVVLRILSILDWDISKLKEFIEGGKNVSKVDDSNSDGGSR